MKIVKAHIKGWIGYTALVLAVLVAHSCALERDEQAAPRATAARTA
ncbi:hypothetical protein [Cupriavidus sp. WS]|nr:hypothetical protein [Cupriavidus sp. WS]